MKVFFLVHDLITVPLGVSYISSVVRERGHDVSAGVLNQRDLIERAEAFGPDVVAFGCTTGFHSKYLEAVSAIRESLDTAVVMGGAHPTFFPEVLEDNDCLDFAVRGEAESAFPQLLEALEGRRELQEVGNIRYRKSGKAVQNPLLPLEEDLDAIPFPDRNLLSHFEQSTNQKALFVITGRGCPYNCSYCFNHCYNELYSGLGRRCRRRSVDNVLEEIEDLRKNNHELQMIVFQDDVFILDRNWVLEFCHQYKERVGLPFHCHLRADLVDDGIARKLSNAGCVSVKMAIESASERLRNDVLNRNMSRKTILNACRSVKKAGIVLVTQNILGIPSGNLRDDLDTLDLNCEIGPDFAFATLLQPYPRTAIGEFCRKNGYLKSDYAHDVPDSFFDCSILEIEDREKRERLRKLFALAIEYPMVHYWIEDLLEYPLEKTYNLMDKLWKGYCIKQREFPYKLTPAEYLRDVITYFRSNYY